MPVRVLPLLQKTKAAFSGARSSHACGDSFCVVLCWIVQGVSKKKKGATDPRKQAKQITRVCVCAP